MSDFIKKFIFALISQMAILLAAIILLFLLLSILPGNTELLLYGIESNPVHLSYNQPSTFELILLWVKGLVLEGNLGESLYYRTPIAPLLKKHFMLTFTLSLMAFFWMIILIGIFAYSYFILRSEKIRYIIRRLIDFLIIIPNYILTILLIIFFVVWIPLFPMHEFAFFQKGYWYEFRGLFLPAIALGMPQALFISKLLFKHYETELKAIYPRAAKAKGLTHIQILERHLNANMWLPLLNYIALIASYFLGGSLIVEKLFNLHGLGELMLKAVSYRDIPLILNLMILIFIFVSFAQFLTTLFLRVLDLKN